MGGAGFLFPPGTRPFLLPDESDEGARDHFSAEGSPFLASVECDRHDPTLIQHAPVIRRNRLPPDATIGKSNPYRRGA